MIKGRDWNSLPQNSFHYLQMKYIQPIEKTKFMASKKTSSSSQTLPKPGLEAGLKIKLNRVSGVGGEGRDQATR